MIDPVEAVSDNRLSDLGWSPFFAEQLTSKDVGLQPVRIARVHRSRLTAVSSTGPIEALLPAHVETGQFAVGDFVLVEPETFLVHRRLERRSVIERRVSGGRTLQLAGANIDTLFIVTSCNAEFNPARLERFLVLANQAGTEPVILLTKADLAGDPESYHRQAGALQRGSTWCPSIPSRARRRCPWLDGADEDRRWRWSVLRCRQVDPCEHTGWHDRNDAADGTIRKQDAKDGTPRRRVRCMQSRAAVG
jgi:ribosome biogenesis GTPase